MTQPTAPGLVADAPDLAARLDPPRTPYLVRADGTPLAVEPPPAVDAEAERKARSLRRMAHIAYLAQCFSFLGGGGGFIGMILAHVGKNRAPEPWLRSHFEWQIRTFWRAIGYSILLAIVLMGVGSVAGVPTKISALLLQVAMGAWCLGRVATGWTRLYYGDAVEDDE